MLEHFKEKDPNLHYPTYIIPADVGLRELDFANAVYQSEEKVFSTATSILTLIATFLGSGFVSNAYALLNKIIRQSDNSETVMVFFIYANLIFAWFLINYFAQRLKVISYAARKIIVLRGKLGLSYGPINMVLPIWRIEGANEPYAIPIFPGYKSYYSFPIHIISLCSSIALFFLLNIAGGNDSNFFSLTTSIAYFISLLILYRLNMLEDHENVFLIFSQLISKMMRIKMSDNIEYIIYRAKLNIIETRRLKLDLSPLYKYAVFLEDRSFYKHYGLSFRGIARAVYQRIKRNRVSGGSTITQQVARTLFIKELHKTYRRKIIEVFLSFWLEKTFTKKDIIEFYVTAVQYDRNVQNIFPAIHHYFDEKTSRLSNAQAFFLIERISNINSAFLGYKVFENIDRALQEQLIKKEEVVELIGIYKEAKRKNKIVEEKGLTIDQVSQRLNV